MNLSTLDQLIILIGGLATIAIYSYLWRENRVFRLFEHLFIGIASGFGIVLTISNFLWPEIISPILGFSVETFPDGTTVEKYQPGYLIYLIPLSFGLLYYTVYSKKLSWLSKVVITFTLGVSGGQQFEGFFNYVIPQITSSFRSLAILNADGSFNAVQSLNNFIFMFTLIATMSYFFFSYKRGNKALNGLAMSGRYLMMVCFGAFFGSTVMARMALLVERVDFLLGDWLEVIRNLF